MATTKSKRGGARPGAGRKPVADEKKANFIFNRALKEIHNTDNEDDAKVEFVKDLYKTARGQQFIAEHIFGKAKDNVDVNVQSKPDLSHLSVDDLRQLMDDSDEE